VSVVQLDAPELCQAVRKFGGIFVRGVRCKAWELYHDSCMYVMWHALYIYLSLENSTLAIRLKATWTL